MPEKKSPVAEPKTRRILATPPIATSIMASKRTPLAPISHNQATRKELTPFERGQILGYATAGYSHSKIGALLGRSKSTIQDALKNSCHNPHGESLPRSGRPPILSRRERRLLVRETRKCPKLTYDQLRKATGLSCSTPTIRNALRDCGLHHWLAKKRPKLTPINAKIRLKWAFKYRHWRYKE